MYALGHTTLLTGTVWLTFLVILYRMSFGCVQSPLTKIVFSALPADRLSMGSGLDGIHRGLAGAFGIAIGSTVLEWRTVVHLLRLSEAHDLSTLSVQEALQAALEMLVPLGPQASSVNAPLAVLWAQLREQAQVTAYQETFFVLSGMTLLAVVPALLARWLHGRGNLNL